MNDFTSVSNPRSEKPSLKVRGLVPLTTIDMPGELAAVLFVQGCSWRCDYCHNPHLQSTQEMYEDIDWLSFLKRRVGLLDGVVFSGGEPTLHPALPHAIQQAKDLGLKVGLHTAGIAPEMLKRVLPLLNWVGFDYKARFHEYHQITGITGSGRIAYASAQHVLESGIPYEFRTTLHPIYHTPQKVIESAYDLRHMGVENYVLQKYRQPATNPLSPEENELSVRNILSDDCIGTIQKIIKRFSMRGFSDGQNRPNATRCLC